MKSLVNVVPPKCSAHHDMIVSDYSEGGYSSGYVCDKCRGSIKTKDTWVVHESVGFVKSVKRTSALNVNQKESWQVREGARSRLHSLARVYHNIVCSYGNNVRKTPSLSGKKVGAIYKGTKVSVVEVRSIQGVKWLRLEDDTWTMGTKENGEEMLRVS